MSLPSEDIDDRLTVLGDNSAIFVHILIQHLNSLLEGRENQVIFSKELENGFGTAAEVSVLFDQVEDAVDHEELGQLLLLVLFMSFQLGFVRGVFGEVRVHPDLDFAVAVEADECLMGEEATDEGVQLLEAVQAVPEHVDVLGVGDIGDVD